jgi:hypothetical protein
MFESAFGRAEREGEEGPKRTQPGCRPALLGSPHIIQNPARFDGTKSLENPGAVGWAKARARSRPRVAPRGEQALGVGSQHVGPYDPEYWSTGRELDWPHGRWPNPLDGRCVCWVFLVYWIQRRLPKEAQADLAIRVYGIRVKAPSEKVDDGLST